MELHCRDLLAFAPAVFQPDAWDEGDTVVQLKLAGPNGGLFYIEIVGRELRVGEGTAPRVDATVETRDELFARMMLNLTNPMLAYMKRQVRIHGKAKLLLKLLNPKVILRDFRLDIGHVS
jgi:hypothetical protein